MIEIEHKHSHAWRGHITNTDGYGNGTIILHAEDDTVDVVTRDNDNDMTIISFSVPDDLRAVAHRMIEEASQLQQRIDIAEGIGGDQ